MGSKIGHHFASNLSKCGSSQRPIILDCEQPHSVVVAPSLRPVQDCKVRFAVVYVDRLDNINHGLKGKQLEDVQQKVSNYSDVCYTADETAAEYVFFIHTKPAVYHGVQTTSNTSTESNPVSGTITDQSGNTSTISGTVDTTTTTTSSVPYEVDYSVFILTILIPHLKEGSTERTFTTLRTFDQKGLYHTMYGIGYGKRKNPVVNVIDAAAKWLHEDNLGK
jgi:hypothetical protein